MRPVTGSTKGHSCHRWGPTSAGGSSAGESEAYKRGFTLLQISGM